MSSLVHKTGSGAFEKYCKFMDKQIMEGNLMPSL
jgi:hypothetical protein